MSNMIVWADVPVLDLERAKKFYADVTGLVALTPPGMEGIGLFRDPDTGPDEMPVAIDLYVGTPSHDGATVYLNTKGDLDGVLARVEPAGGRILQEKRFMGDMVGWVAFIEDPRATASACSSRPTPSKMRGRTIRGRD